MAGQPRNHAGQFKRGYLLWQRPDGEVRWVFWPQLEPIDEDCRRALYLTEAARRLLTHLFLIAVVAVLIGLFW